MSSRALRRLQKDIIPLPGDNGDLNKDVDFAEEEDTFIQPAVNRKKNKKKSFAANPFDLVRCSIHLMPLLMFIIFSFYFLTRWKCESFTICS